MKLILSLILAMVLSNYQIVFASDICSRTATVNYQEVLVDSSSSKLGEGLRFYLEKDPEAKKLLDEYQHSNKMRWIDAAMSTTGSGLIIFGLFRSSSNKDNGLLTRQSMILGGTSLIVLSYLISRTIQFNNEKYLMKSIEEYNKRNTPRIYFSPISQSGLNGTSSIGLTAGLSRDF